LTARMRSGAFLITMLCALPPLAAAQTAAAVPEGNTVPVPPGTPVPDEIWALHGQGTFTEQYHPAFRAAFSGPNSLNPGSRGAETFDAGFYAGVRPWSGAELWINPEIDQGFGLSNTLGIAAFSSGEAYKVGSAAPYVRVPRLFLRQTIRLGGAPQKTESDLTTLAAATTANRIVVTIGKFGVPDVFDTNSYAHDPRQDFMNWAFVDTGTFDYAADAWGFSYGAAAEWYQDWWTLRAGAFALSRVPNGKALDTSGGQDQYVGEAEERHMLFGQAGKLKITAFLSRGRMGDYLDAVALAAQSGGPATIAAVREYRSRSGVSLDLEQPVTDQLGVFARAGISEGGREAYEFTDINKTLAFGISVQGSSWGRPGDTFGLATVIDDLSRRGKTFLANGGLGVLGGDGKLLNSGPEQVVESYYSFAIRAWLHVSADYQFVNNPAYNRDRGPVSILGARIHFQY
jgi:high affinity Mn2+ porin